MESIKDGRFHSENFDLAGMHEAWSMLMELDMMGAHLPFRVLMRLSRVNRRLWHTYAATWPMLWRARRDTKPADFRVVMLLAVSKSAVEHVRVLTAFPIQPPDNQMLMMLCQRTNGQTLLHIAVRMQAQKPSDARLAVVRALLKAGGKKLVHKHMREQDDGDFLKVGPSALHIAAQGKCVLTAQTAPAVSSSA